MAREGELYSLDQSHLKRSAQVQARRPWCVDLQERPQTSIPSVDTRTFMPPMLKWAGCRLIGHPPALACVEGDG
jgi:hypothetical protein